MKVQLKQNIFPNKHLRKTCHTGINTLQNKQKIIGNPNKDWQFVVIYIHPKLILETST